MRAAMEAAGKSRKGWSNESAGDKAGQDGGMHADPIRPIFTAVHR
jgi:hypothetical protein